MSITINIKSKLNIDRDKFLGYENTICSDYKIQNM